MMSCINVLSGISLQNTVNLYRIGHFYFAKIGHYYIAFTAYATSAITKDYAPKQPKLLTKVIEEKEQKKVAEFNVIAIKKNDSNNQIKKISKLFEKIDMSIQDALKLEFQNNGMRGPVKKLFEREGWCSDQIINHFFIFLTSQIEQGRRGQGYDQLNSLLLKDLSN